MYCLSSRGHKSCVFIILCIAERAHAKTDLCDYIIVFFCVVRVVLMQNPCVGRFYLHFRAVCLCLRENHMISTSRDSWL